jgi:murein DD-endopeptidase MepM/ murein hydrolase activator NlpD
LATLHQQHSLHVPSTTPAAARRSPSARSVRPGRWRRAGLVTATLLAALTAAPLVPAAAAPGESAARSERDSLRAEVAGLEQRVEKAEEHLQRLTIEAEAASGAALEAQAALDVAQEEAQAAAAELAEARAAVDRLQSDVADLGREAYMGEDGLGNVVALLDSGSPGEVLQRAATLELLGDGRAGTLDDLEVVEVRHATADREAREAVQRRDDAARAAAEAQEKVEARRDEAQRRFDAMTAEKSKLDRRLKRAQIRLLELARTPDPVRTWERAEEAEEAAEVAVSAVRSAGGAVAPATGRVTSCYGARWGTMHLGVDIAAPIGTPVFTPEAGVVLQAGSASGFGQAVYVQHGDGSITLYGHVSRFHVSAGQTVSAGQRIADVGNEGQSTGPHLHFEVHSGGLYANRVNPMPWLSSHGISLGGC